MDNKNLLKGTMVYTFANILTKMGSLIFLPIMTRILTQEQFGIIGTLSPITTLFTVLLGLGLYNAQMKKYVELKENENELGSYMFTVTAIVITINALLFLFLLTPIAEKWFSYIIDLKTISYRPLILISIFTAFINALNTLAITLFRMKKMYVKVAIGTLISFFTNYILAVYFIKILKLGVFGNQMANLIAVGVLLIYCFKDYFLKFKFKVKKEYIGYSMKNGLPLIFIELTDQIVNFSDRIVLARFVDLATVGYYTLAYTAGRVLTVVTGSFVNSWTPEFYEAMKKDPHNRKVTKSIEDFLAIITIVCVLAQLFAPEAIMLIFPKNYYNAIPYVPIILAAVVIQALYCLDYFFHFHENSIYILWFTVFAMLFNLGFNLLLIPGNVQHGALIASWTTLIAFLLRAAIEMVVIKKKYKVEFDYKKLLIYLFIIINPFILYLATEDLSITKFLLKLLYLGIVMKIMINKVVADKILSILFRIKGKIIKK